MLGAWIAAIGTISPSTVSAAATDLTCSGSITFHYQQFGDKSGPFSGAVVTINESDNTVLSRLGASGRGGPWIAAFTREAISWTEVHGGEK
jgi:hypothetical protein